MRLLALCSALATGLVIWAGLGRREDSGPLAAAVVQHGRLLASAAAAAAAAPQTATSPVETPAGGGAAESSSAAASGETAEVGTTNTTAAPSKTTAPSQEASETPSTTAPVAQTPTSTPKTNASGTSTPKASTPRRSVKPTQSKIKHVFVITLASPGYEQTWGTGSPAHYLTNQLRPRGTLLSNYYAIGHLDLPSYIAMISGQPPNADTSADCPTFAEFPAGKPDALGRLDGPGCVYPVSVLTLADQLTSTRHQWRAYIEDLANGPKPVQSCRHPVSNQPDETQRARPGDAYATRHNPFVYFHSLLDLGDCASDDLPLTQLPADLAYEAKTPNYAFIAPNLCHDGSEPTCPDGSPGGLQAADAFLAEWVPKILASPAYRRDGLLVITFSDAPQSDHVGALLLSPYVTPGGESATTYNHYSLLRTIEDIFGLAHLANAAAPGVSSFLPDVLKGH